MNISIEQLQRGNERALRLLFDQFYPELCSFVCSYVQDTALAADMAQETFLKYWEHHADFDNVLKIKSFLYTSARNEALNYLRDRKGIRTDLSAVASDLFFSNALIKEEGYRIFYNAIDALSPQEQQVIQLSLDGLRNAEIAARMHIAESSVHTFKKLAYKKLRILLKDYFYLWYIALGI